MEYVYLGNSGLKVSNLCLGTMTFGEGDGCTGGSVEEADAHSLLDAYVKAGGNFIDTADVYQAGKSETIVGNWLKKQPNRDRFVVATKLRFPSDPNDPNAGGLSRKKIICGVEAALARLQTSYIDLLQTHCWDAGTPVEETLAALADLVKAGKVHYIGCSNVTGWQLQKLVMTAERMGLPKLVSCQEQYSLLCRQTEFEVTDVCLNEGLALLPWSPLKGGMLSGKFKKGVPAAEGTRMAWATKNDIKLQSAPTDAQFAEDELAWALIDLLTSMAEEKGRSVPQIALRWLLQKPVVTSVVIGVKSMKHLEDNLGAASSDWELTEKDMQTLDEASAACMKGGVPYPYEMVWRCQGARKRRRLAC